MARWEPLGIIADTECCVRSGSVQVSQGDNEVCLTEEELQKLLSLIDIEKEREKS